MREEIVFFFLMSRTLLFARRSDHWYRKQLIFCIVNLGYETLHSGARRDYHCFNPFLWKWNGFLDHHISDVLFFSGCINWQIPSRIKKERNSVSKSIFHPTTSQNMSQIILIYRYLPLHLYITAHLIVRSHSRSEELSEAIICIPFGLFCSPRMSLFCVW